MAIMEKQITIIIPTYNMENYIEKCLDSLLIPELEAVEVMVVNDGSKDKSSEIAHQYAERYPKSIKVIDKENGNYGSCINKALPLVSGRYVKVLDADDSFDKAAFSEFVKILTRFDEDLIVTNFIKIDENGNFLEQSDFSNYPADYSGEMTEMTYSFFKHYVPMHRLTYKTEIFSTFDYHQTEGISYTDAQWAIIPLSYCKTVRFLDLCLYRYLFGRVGQTMDPIIRQKSVSQLWKVIGDISKFYENHKGRIINRPLLRLQLLEFHNNLYHAVLSYGPEYIKEVGEYDNSLKQISHEIYNLVGKIPYDPIVNYKYFAALRKADFNVGFNVPKRVLYELSIKYQFKKFFQPILNPPIFLRNGRK